MNLIASFLALNPNPATCRPVARIGDQVDPSSLQILTGSSTVCAS
jgi:hypothetical protein